MVRFEHANAVAFPVTIPKATSSSPHDNLIKLFFYFCWHIQTGWELTNDVKRTVSLSNNSTETASNRQNQSTSVHSKRTLKSDTRPAISVDIFVALWLPKPIFVTFTWRGPEGSFFGKPTVQKSRGDNREKSWGLTCLSIISHRGYSRSCPLRTHHRLTDDVRTTTK